MNFAFDCFFTSTPTPKYQWTRIFGLTRTHIVHIFQILIYAGVPIKEFSNKSANLQICTHVPFCLQLHTKSHLKYWIYIYSVSFFHIALNQISTYLEFFILDLFLASTIEAKQLEKSKFFLCVLKLCWLPIKIGYVKALKGFWPSRSSHFLFISISNLLCLSEWKVNKPYITKWQVQFLLSLQTFLRPFFRHFK